MGKRTNTAVWVESRGRWQINVQKDNERKTFVCSKPGRTGQRECNAKADAWLDEGISSTASIFDDAAKEYLEDVKLRSSDYTYHTEKYRWDHYLSPVIGRKKLSDLSDGMLQTAINKMKNVNGNPLSRKMYKNLRATLFAVIKYARRNKLTSYHPDGIVIPSNAIPSSKTTMQLEDVAKVFSSESKTIRYGKEVPDIYVNAYRLALLTGMRPGEIVGLMWGDIKDDTIYIRHSINVAGDVTNGKNDNARRSIVMTKYARKVIDDQREMYGKSSLYVFGIASQSTYRHNWKKFCESNGIHYVSLYEMRHTFISIAKTLPDGLVKPLVGHSEDMDTYGTYGHALNGDDLAVVDGLTEIFSTILKPDSKQKAN